MKGATGATGPTGSIGPHGTTGSTGPAGSTGPHGITGSTGPAGERGPQGVAGPAGQRGPQGPAGSQGPAGPQGERGQIGFEGRPGAKGDTGPAGPRGPQGYQGDRGPQGPQGARGITSIEHLHTRIVDDTVINDSFIALKFSEKQRVNHATSMRVITSTDIELDPGHYFVTCSLRTNLAPDQSYRGYMYYRLKDTNGVTYYQEDFEIYYFTSIFVIQRLVCIDLKTELEVVGHVEGSGNSIKIAQGELIIIRLPYNGQ